jgi:hypothetical protein
MPEHDDIDAGETTQDPERATGDVVIDGVEPEETEDLAAEAPEDEEPAPPAVSDAVVVPDSADAALVEAVSGGLTWIPFASYLVLWIILAGVSAYLLYGADAEQPARWMPEYVPLLWSGVGLTALGPILSVVVWLIARSRRAKDARRGLFASAMTRGALVAFFGVAIWVATLFVLEIVAAGGAL